MKKGFGKFVLEIFLIVAVSGIILFLGRKYLPAEKAYVTNVTQEEKSHKMYGRVARIDYRIICDRTIGEETEKQIPLELDAGEYEHVKEYGYYLVGGWADMIWDMLVLIDFFLVVMAVFRYAFEAEY